MLVNEIRIPIYDIFIIKRKIFKISPPPKECHCPSPSAGFVYFKPIKDYLSFLCLIGINYSSKGWLAIDKNPFYKKNESHDGFILVHEQFAEISFYGEGFDILIDFFKDHHLPYNVYLCHSLEEFKNVVNNPIVVNLWIFGHGSRGGIGCRKDKLNYKEF